MTPHRVFLVDDDLAARGQLARAIEQSQHFTLTGEAGGLAEAHRAMAPIPNIDVLLVDLELPDGHGVELIRYVRKFRAETLILVFSVFGDERSVARCIQAGASGYLLKGDSLPELEQVMLELVEGGSPLSPRVARYVLEMARNPQLAPAPQVAEDTPKLSVREIEVLELLAKGFGPREVASVLGISAHTVTSHSRTIHRKLEVSSRAAAIFEALSLGLIKL